MVDVIAEHCIAVKDKACNEEYTVDCIYAGERMLHIHPGECATAAPASRSARSRRSSTETTYWSSGPS
jgi:hypothetical protein